MQSICRKHDPIDTSA